MDRLHDYIFQAVPHGSRVLDLGCGDGRLLAELVAGKGVLPLGLDIDTACIEACLRRGVPALQLDIDRDGLLGFRDEQFDVAVVQQTIQVLRHPLPVLEDVLRVARECMVVFPNFAHWRNRLRLLFHGRMPVSHRLPYEWYDTPNIHLMSMADFEGLCAKKGVRILARVPIGEGPADRTLIALGRLNLGSTLCLMHLAKGADWTPSSRPARPGKGDRPGIEGTP